MPHLAGLEIGVPAHPFVLGHVAGAVIAGALGGSALAALRGRPKRRPMPGGALVSVLVAAIKPGLDAPWLGRVPMSRGR